ncbi:MAG TPA: hypothetical protein VMS86_11180, partial [Thermoanaerobaculia bacterium]|nr:hypothetical protein [Thermoanaerobaculia bacterium]
MNRPPLRRAWIPLTLVLVAVSGAVDGDDRDMLKFRAAKPYLFILLDTSASMNLRFAADGGVPGHGDDPASRIWGAKEALFQVFHDVSDVHFGFATMNQDELRVPSFHWLYYLESIPAGWPFQGPGAEVVWPLPDPNGLTTDHITVDLDGDGIPDIGDGIPDHDVDGDAIVFGRAFTDANGALIPGGTCEAPLPIDTERGRQQVNAYAKTGANGTSSTTMWFQIGKGGGAKRYRLIIERPGKRPDDSPNATLGQDKMLVHFHLSGPVSSCSSIPDSTKYGFDFRKDPWMNRFIMVD